MTYYSLGGMLRAANALVACEIQSNPDEAPSLSKTGRMTSGKRIWLKTRNHRSFHASAKETNMNSVESLYSFLQAKLHQGDVDFDTLPFPAFVTDTRSPPLQVRFELDVRNDRNMASWRTKWRYKLFNEGLYGWQPVEEKVGRPRPALSLGGPSQRAIGLDPLAEAGKLHALTDAHAS